MNESSLIRISNEGDRTEVELFGEMTIDRVGELKSGLLQAFALGKKVHISLTEVSQADTAGLQLLCSAHRTSSVMNLGLSVSGIDSGEIGKVAALAGLPRHAGCGFTGRKNCVWAPCCSDAGNQGVFHG